MPKAAACPVHIHMPHGKDFLEQNMSLKKWSFGLLQAPPNLLCYSYAKYHTNTGHHDVALKGEASIEPHRLTGTSTCAAATPYLFFKTTCKISRLETNV